MLVKTMVSKCCVIIYKKFEGKLYTMNQRSVCVCVCVCEPKVPYQTRGRNHPKFQNQPNNSYPKDRTNERTSEGVPFNRQIETSD